MSSNYKAEDCYFAIEVVDDVGLIAAICPKDYWDEEGELDKTFTLDSLEDSSILEVLDQSTLNNVFEFIEEYISLEDAKEKMVDLGFEYSLELQTSLDQIDSEDDDDDFDEDEDLDDEDDTTFVKYTDYSLN